MSARTLLLFALTGLAGFGAGGLFPGGTGEQFLSGLQGTPAVDVSGTSGDRMIGASDSQETALGSALLFLRERNSDLGSLAAFGAVLEQLDAAQMARLLEFVERDRSSGYAGRLGWLFKRWMKRDRTAAVAWLQPRLEAMVQDGPAGFSFEGSGNGQLALAWASAEPQAALDFARAHSRAGLATALLRRALSTWWRELGDRGCLALALDFPPGSARDTAIHELHESWAAREPGAAMASAQALPAGGERQRTVRAVLSTWADRDAPAAFAQYQALGLHDSALLSKILVTSAKKDPAQSLAWLGQLGPVQFGRCAAQVVEIWAMKDPAAALGWALENGVQFAPREEVSTRVRHAGFGRSSGLSWRPVRPLPKALESKPQETLDWLRSLPAGPDRDRLTEIAVEASRDLDQALALFEALPPDAAARTASNIATRFAGNPDGARAWAESLPAGPARSAAWARLGWVASTSFDLPRGPDRDAYLSGMTSEPDSSVMKPAKRLGLILDIDDPVLRRDTFDEAMEWFAASPSGFAQEARAALDASTAPEEWKKMWRDVLPKER